MRGCASSSNEEEKGTTEKGQFESAAGKPWTTGPQQGAGKPRTAGPQQGTGKPRTAQAAH